MERIKLDPPVRANAQGQKVAHRVNELVLFTPTFKRVLKEKLEAIDGVRVTYFHKAEGSQIIEHLAVLYKGKTIYIDTWLNNLYKVP